MSLDTFEKRLASQGRPLPGGISTRDRWSIGGAYQPSAWSEGTILATLGAAVLAFSGTFTPGPGGNLNFADRMHLEGRPFPGDLQVENRFAIGGSFRHIAGGTDVVGKIVTSLGAAAVSFRGAVTDGATPLSLEDRYHVEGRPLPGAGITVRDRYAIGGSFTRIPGGTAPGGGRISAATGQVTASVRGSHAASIYFDVDYSTTPAFSMTVMPGRDGALAWTLGAAVAALRGTSLPPNSVAGQVRTISGSAVAHLTGTMTPPASRDGRVHADASAVAMHLRGSVVPPQGNIGHLPLAAGTALASLRGTFTAWSTDGRLSVVLDPAAFRGYGQPLLPGDIYGFMDARPAPVDVALRGTSVILVGDLVADEIVVEPQFSGSVEVEPEFDGSVTMEPMR